MRLTIQFCTYKRPQLLARVLEACFDQTVPPQSYEVVLVNDGSPDDTPDVIERLRPFARCGFTVVHQANAGLAKARNAGLACSRGQRIVFIDDDVLPTPVFVEEHLRSDARYGDVIVRGAVINTASFDRLPPPVWSPANYSANYFWTSNVSLRRTRLDRAGGTFDESFAEYGWEDIELGMRLRALGTRGVFNKRAVAFHFKPPPQAQSVAGVLRQVRAQARTAVQLERKHPHWRVALAVGDTPPQRWLGNAVTRSGIGRRLEPLVERIAGDQRLNAAQRAAVGVLATQAYYDELLRARAAHR
ncbi:MAG: glycosyltransferase [Candidatus Velthaea sp.]